MADGVCAPEAGDLPLPSGLLPLERGGPERADPPGIRPLGVPRVGRGEEAGGSADAEGLRRQLGEGGGGAGVAAVGAEAGLDHGVGDLTEQREVAVGLVAGALRELTEREGLSLRDAVEWCGDTLSVREATRLRRLASDQADSGDGEQGGDGAAVLAAARSGGAGAGSAAG